MALALKDRVKETTIVVGTGTATLLGSSIGFQPFSVVGNGNTTYYCISDQFGSNWEVGIGTYTASGNTLSRTTVLASSNAGALVVFTAGIKDVFVTYPAEKGVWLDASGNAIGLGTPASGVVTNLTGTASININGTVGATTATTGSFTNLAYTGTLTGSTGVLNIGSGQVYKDASGNVGIGTSIPSQRLSVEGNLNVSGTAGCSSFAADNTVTDTTLRTYTANTVYTLPTVVTILGQGADTFLVSIFIQYDGLAYHNWTGSAIISLTYWNALGNSSAWSTQMSTHVNGNPVVTFYDTTGSGSRQIAFSINSTLTVTTGGFVRVTFKRIAAF